MRTEDFDFDLPQKFIAQDPVVPRDSSKMFAFDTSAETVKHLNFRDLGSLLGQNDCLLLNSSKVIPARILFTFEGKELEIFLLNKLGAFEYRCLVRPGKLFGIDRKFSLSSNVGCVVLEVYGDGTRRILFDSTFDLSSFGDTPLPPYIKNSSASTEQYQTVYSDNEGSVAAPTAGLHFTDRLLADLSDSGVQIERATLHVGRGTFLPVSADRLEDHKMHAESYSLNNETAASLNLARLKGKRFIAVGTTGVRILESTFDALTNSFVPADSSTELFIYPGAYNWKTVDALITNFHLPKSTLIMLVASFLESKGVSDGRSKILELYEMAKSENYRFYSFGDSMFIY
jgi:S-adenosylmethionine:tRNA ribosyltransferase-isomerase